MRTDHANRTLRTGEHTCRRAHACHWCPLDRSIAAGGRMVVVVSLEDGELRQRRYCLDGGAGCWAEHHEAETRPLREDELAF